MFLQYSRVCTNDVESSQADQKGTVVVVFSSVALVWWRRAPKQHGQIPPRWPCFRDSLVARRCTAVLAPWRLGLQRCRRLLVVIPHVSSEFLRLAWWQHTTHSDEASDFVRFSTWTYNCITQVAELFLEIWIKMVSSWTFCFSCFSLFLHNSKYLS